MKTRKFTRVEKRLCPSGAWDNGAYKASAEDKVEIPEALMAEAVIVRMPGGVKGVHEPVMRIDLRGQSYLVLDPARDKFLDPMRG